MLILLTLLLGCLDLFIGGYLWHHQTTNVVGIDVNRNPQLTKFCRIQGGLFLSLGLLIIIFIFTPWAIVAIILVIISMLATVVLSWQFSSFLKHIQ